MISLVDTAYVWNGQTQYWFFLRAWNDFISNVVLGESIKIAFFYQNYVYLTNIVAISCLLPVSFFVSLVVQWLVIFFLFVSCSTMTCYLFFFFFFFFFILSLVVQWLVLFRSTIRRRSDYIIGFIAPAIGPNKSKKFTRLIALAHNIRGKVWMKNNVHGFTADNCLSVKPCMLFFIQTLPRILCTGAVSLVSFFDLFGPIAGAINPIM